MVEVRVPATSANMGAGFDCFGIALSLYNIIRVKEIDEGLIIKNIDSDEYIPTGKNNLIYRSVNRVFDEVGYEKKGLMITQKSSIPMTRGLGSSSACIVGGLIAGNIISGRKLTTQKLFELATEIEGHPDNVCPALFGGFCISCRDDEVLTRKTIRVLNDIKFIAFVSEYFVVTNKSRKLLPDKVSLKDATYNLSHAAAFAVSLATGDYKNINIFSKDRLHQHYREEIIDDMTDIFNVCGNFGAYGTFLSGSGPTIIAMVDSKNKEFITKIQDYFRKNNIKRRCIELSVDNVGAVSKEI